MSIAEKHVKVSYENVEGLNCLLGVGQMSCLHVHTDVCLCLSVCSSLHSQVFFLVEMNHICNCQAVIFPFVGQFAIANATVCAVFVSVVLIASNALTLLTLQDVLTISFIARLILYYLCIGCFYRYKQNIPSFILVFLYFIGKIK